MNKNNSAFPLMPSHTNPADVVPDFTGLTKRELFAAMAMQGMCSNMDNANLQNSPTNVVMESVQFADALLKALESNETI
jgi:hypothetical protein